LYNRVRYQRGQINARTASTKEQLLKEGPKSFIEKMNLFPVFLKRERPPVLIVGGVPMLGWKKANDVLKMRRKT